MKSIAEVSFSNTQTGKTVKYKDLETNPDVYLVGVDDNFSRMLNYAVDQGRPLSQIDMEMGNNNCIIGSLMLLITSDEEGLAIDGTPVIVEYLQKNNINIVKNSYGGRIT